MTLIKQVERYPLGRSPLHRLGRNKDLAEVLGLSQKAVTRLLVRRHALYSFREEVIGEKTRSLAVPLDEMRAVHERLKGLLGRIKLPDYLYSPRRGRAASDNALAHQGAQVTVKLDVKQFYPSTTDEHVFQFFRYRLGMVDDVAGRLTKICTINGRVAFGSPLSPILCALVHDDLFSSVAKRCELSDDCLTLWVDDLTISGDTVAAGLVRDIERMIAAKGLVPHKAQRSSQRRGIVITGTFVGPKGPAPANKSHLKLRQRLNELDRTTDPAGRKAIAQSLIGMVNHQLTIYPKDGAEHARLRKRLQWLWNVFRQADNSQTVTLGPAFQEPRAETAVPW